MEKVGLILKRSILTIGVVWLCLVVMTFLAMVVGNMFFDSGTSHALDATFSFSMGNREEAVVELQKATIDGLTGNRIAVGVYTAAQILLPFKWNDFAALRAKTLAYISEEHEIYTTTLAAATE
jgi:hypothetical protein